MKASRKEIQEWAIVKLHPNFNAALAECGMPFDTSSAVLQGEFLCEQHKLEALNSV